MGVGGPLVPCGGFGIPLHAPYVPSFGPTPTSTHSIPNHSKGPSLPPSHHPSLPPHLGSYCHGGVPSDLGRCTLLLLLCYGGCLPPRLQTFLGPKQVLPLLRGRHKVRTANRQALRHSLDCACVCMCVMCVYNVSVCVCV